MDLSLRIKTYLQDDQTWLASAHGTDAAVSITLDLSSFDKETHYPQWFIRSGTALTRDDASGLYRPYFAGAQPAGFLLTAVRVRPVNTSVAHGALLVHGQVHESRLPVEIDEAAKEALAGRFVFVNHAPEGSS